MISRLFSKRFCQDPVTCLGTPAVPHNGLSSHHNHADKTTSTSLCSPPHAPQSVSYTHLILSVQKDFALTGFLDSGDHLCKLFLSVSFHTGNSKMCIRDSLISSFRLFAFCKLKLYYNFYLQIYQYFSFHFANFSVDRFFNMQL